MSNCVKCTQYETCAIMYRVSKGAKIRNRYNQVPHLTQDTNEKETNSQLDTTNKSQEVSPFPAGDHKAHINRRVQRHSKHKTEKTLKIHKRTGFILYTFPAKYLDNGISKSFIINIHSFCG